MKKRIWPSLFLLSLAITACGALAPTQAHTVYAKAGFLGAGLGYSHRISNQFALRADFTTVGAFKHSGTIDLLQYRQLNYRARFKSHQLGIYGDWFPFASGLRLTAGLHLRQLQADLKLHPSVINVRIGKKTLPYHPKEGDNLTGRVKFPALAPYLGIGWESSPGKSRGGGALT